MTGRASAAAVGRSVGFYTAFYLGTVVLVLWALVAMAVMPRSLCAVVTRWAAFHRFCVTRLLGIAVIVHGGPQQAPALYAFKHESFFEAIDLPNLLPEPVPFAKAELLRLPLWGWAARSYGVIPVARDKGAKALRAMVAAARAQADGRPLVIFPEGTRVPHGKCPPLQAGFAGLYKLLGLPVIPVAVVSGPLYHRWWKPAGTIVIRFGEAIPPGLSRDTIEARVHAAINVLNGGSSS